MSAGAPRETVHGLGQQAVNVTATHGELVAAADAAVVDETVRDEYRRAAGVRICVWATEWRTIEASYLETSRRIHGTRPLSRAGCCEMKSTF